MKEEAKDPFVMPRIHVFGQKELRYEASPSQKFPAEGGA